MNNKNKINSFLFFILLTTITFSFGFGKGLESIGRENVKWPVEKSKKITSLFGYRKSPFGSGKLQFHNGVDIGAPPGEKIIAVEDGKITKASFYGGYGHTICLKGKSTKRVYLYGHLDEKYIVKVGQEVKKGDIIGGIGPLNVYNVKNNPYRDFQGRPTNGNTTGPHLHFSIIKDGKFIDPMPFLKEISK